MVKMNPQNHRIRPQAQHRPPDGRFGRRSAHRCRRPVHARSRPVPTNREVVSKSVDEFLPLVIERLQRAGLTARPTGRRKPRNLDNVVWQRLLEAEAEVSLSQIELLRCCLVLAAQRVWILSRVTCSCFSIAAAACRWRSPSPTHHDGTAVPSQGR